MLHLRVRKRTIAYYSTISDVCQEKWEGFFGGGRGAPHTALPYAASGGVAAAPCRPAPKRAGRRAARVVVVQGGAPFYTPPICRSARNAAFRRRFRGKRGLRKPKRPPTRGRGSREAADKPLQEAGAFELLFFFAQTRRLSISPPPLPPRQTPPFSRAAF